MFVGGFQTNFKNNLFALQLPEHAALDSDAWQFVGERGRATPLISQPDRTSWDHFGLHTPSYVRGEVGGVPVERIFYAGRGSTRVVDNTTPYSIGVLTRREGAWHRHPDPVLTGTGESPNVLEPKAAWLDGKWRVWFTTTPQEAGKHAQVRYRIDYVESDDGLTGWSKPVTVFDEADGYYDAAVSRAGERDFTLLLCRSTNLYGRAPFPEQGLWLASGGQNFGARDNWRIEGALLRCDAQTPEWYRHGPFGPSLVTLEQPTPRGASACVFFSGVDSRRNWWSLAWRNLRRRKWPPPPAPFFFSLGRLDLASA